MSNKKHLLMQVFFLLGAAFVYFLVCWPALNGMFVLDDWPNLGGLEKVKSWKDIWLYSLSGPSSSVGRPVSYFSFALQSTHWPNNPLPFKQLSLFVHLANGLLCYSCCFICAIHLGFKRERVLFFAGLCALLWMFAPLHASTVFYVVQRMTLLAGFFTWLGILGFLAGSLLESKGRPYYGRCVATVFMVFAYMLGILSKENAVLVGVFVATLYYFIVTKNVKIGRRWWDVWVLVFAIMPVLLTAVYLVWNGRYLNGYGIRDFNTEQRFYSQWRILWEYTAKIVLPTAEQINVFNDDFEFSKSLFDPVKTFLSGIMWLVVILFSWATRKKLPFLLFGVTWFLGGHLLESTFVGLELYFEHRNYMPSFGFIFAIVWGGIAAWEWLDKYSSLKVKIWGRTFLIGSAAVYCLWFVMVLSAESMSWKDQKSFVFAALTDRPNSLRAHQEAASYLANQGDYHGSATLLRKIDVRWPDYPGTYAWMLYIQCVEPGIPIPNKEELTKRFETGRFDRGVSEALHELYLLKRKGACSHIAWTDFREWLEMLMRNPNLPRYGINDNLFRLKIFSYIVERDLSKANALFESREESSLNISLLRLKVELLSLDRRDKDALSVIQRVKERYSGNKKVWALNGHFFLDLEEKINTALGVQKYDEDEKA